MPGETATAEPARLAEFAPAKVNLALHVLGRRADGYHELDSLVAFADVGDRLWFEPAESLVFSASGPFAGALPTAVGEQIALRAAQALSRATGIVAGAHVHLEKNLPVASGIGGGSADAAAALRGLSRLWGVSADLAAIGLTLGADVPVCLGSRACRMRGLGERIEALSDFSPCAAVLVNPLVPVATADVFRALALKPGDRHLQGIGVALDPAACRNDLMAAAIGVRPEIARVLASLTAQDGIRFARMSGSGATCFALFETRTGAEAAQRALRAHHPGWWIAAVTLT